MISQIDIFRYIQQQTKKIIQTPGCEYLKDNLEWHGVRTHRHSNKKVFVSNLYATAKAKKIKAQLKAAGFPLPLYISKSSTPNKSRIAVGVENIQSLFFDVTSNKTLSIHMQHKNLEVDHPKVDDDKFRKTLERTLELYGPVENVLFRYSNARNVNQRVLERLAKIVTEVLTEYCPFTIKKINIDYIYVDIWNGMTEYDKPKCLKEANNAIRKPYRELYRDIHTEMVYKLSIEGINDIRLPKELVTFLFKQYISLTDLLPAEKDMLPPSNLTYQNHNLNS